MGGPISPTVGCLYQLSGHHRNLQQNRFMCTAHNTLRDFTVERMSDDHGVSIISYFLSSLYNTKEEKIRIEVMCIQLKRILVNIEPQLLRSHHGCTKRKNMINEYLKIFGRAAASLAPTTAASSPMTQTRCTHSIPPVPTASPNLSHGRPNLRYPKPPFQQPRLAQRTAFPIGLSVE